MWMILAAALAASPPPVIPAAYAESLSTAFANTIVSTYPDGRIAKLWLDADGAYHGLMRSGGHTAGKWQVKDSRICLKQYHPFFYPFSYCTPIQQGGVGTTWTGKAPTGEPIRLVVVSGRADEPKD